jgi:hypothetical protein
MQQVQIQVYPVLNVSVISAAWRMVHTGSLKRDASSCVHQLALGHAIAQTDSCQLPTAVARLQSHVRSCEVWTKGGGAGFLCQFSYHQLLHTHHHHLPPGAGTIGQIVADVPSGLSHPTLRRKLILQYLSIIVNDLFSFIIHFLPLAVKFDLIIKFDFYEVK